MLKVEIRKEIASLEEELVGMVLSEERKTEKQLLIDQAFSDWNRKDFRAYVSACEKNGRENLEKIVEDVEMNTSKTKDQIVRYHEVFWKSYKQLNDWEKVIDKIEKGEQKIARVIAIKEGLRKKVENFDGNPWLQLQLNYGSNKGKTFTEAEDRFIICMTNKLGTCSLLPRLL